MWIFLNNAMLSIVAHRDKPSMLLVRARALPDITRVFPAAQVQVLKSADYWYRTEVPRQEVAAAIAKQVASIDYWNFKSSVREDDRHDAYMDVWEKMHDFQVGFYGPPRRPRPARLTRLRLNVRKPA